MDFSYFYFKAESDFENAIWRRFPFHRPQFLLSFPEFYLNTNPIHISLFFFLFYPISS